MQEQKKDIEIKRTKICTNCKLEKFLKEFSKHQNCLYGVNSVCGFCSSIKNIEYRIRKEKEEKRICGIYKITSPNNKVYVGQSINIKQRFNYYKNLNKSVYRQPKLYYSLKKYGPENHQFEIIEECSEVLVLEREIYWKQFYNSVEEGLNCELYDFMKGPRSEETKQKISKAHKGKVFTEEHKNNLSKSRKGKPSKRKGKPDYKQKGISKPQVSIKTKGKPKIGSGPKTGNYILDLKNNCIHFSVKECMIFNKISKRYMFKLLKDKNSNFQYFNKNYWK